MASAAPTDTERGVARLIAAEIEDGACLQVGIGAMLNTVCSLLLHSGAHQRDRSVGFLQPVDLGDVEMVQRGEDFRFALEACETFWIAGH